METKPIKQRISYLCFRLIRWLVWLFYPKTTIQGLENLPDEACIVVGNHTQMNGPIVGELYFPGDRRIWCAGQMMHLKDVPAYAYQDFWSEKPKGLRWFYKILSYLIAPLSTCVFQNAHTIGVYHDARIVSTFRKTVQALENGANVVIFPECPTPHNNIINQFQDKFIDVAKLYYKRTGKAVCFVPMYIAPKLKTSYIGTPIRFDPETPMDQERSRIRDCLMAQITDIAVNLPPHIVVPYSNVSKKLYPKNKPEVSACEKTSC